jgi:ribosomal protein S18 acetylase RimI-like enzyme
MAEIRCMHSEDLGEVNVVFTKAFSHARVEEGLKQHRVSPCRPEFLRMYLDRSGEGAIVAIDRGQVVGFNFNHLYGATGWMGPLAVLPRYQGAGVGKAVVRGGIEYLRTRGANTIGLETMPRNFRNIGFYLGLGFNPGPLCLDMVSQTHSGGTRTHIDGVEIASFREGGERGREDLLRGCTEVAHALSPGLDYAGEILLNMENAFGDTVFLMDDGVVAGLAICHLEPYGQFEERRELKVSVLAMRPESGATEPSGEALARLAALLSGVRDLAARERLLAVRLHVRSDKWKALSSLLSWGYAVGYSDLRMFLEGFGEDDPAHHIHFCRWQ